ncbi:MAG: Orange carotenoid-binding protein [Chroococcopsis gigantea SAG 12.99]|nr:nuclear transport factor 2 family protein [Chlorogloea purpurea SAG 13.99]MDV2999406.1 Orange carotenoid-binding protein [Chroococcopsis gigantea SAG 12.99]
MSQATSMSSLSSPETPDNALISGYFDSINRCQFQKTSALFSEDGILYPPFDKPVKGRQCINDYLEKEFKGFLAFPQESIEQCSEDEKIRYTVLGTVANSLFTVKVSWDFVINDAREIESVAVKLLASFKELLNLTSTQINE